METKDLYQLFLQHPVVTTDSRDCPPGSIFFALRGESFDGNRFAAAALEQGCAYAVVDDATVVNMVEHGLGISMMTELTLKGRAERVLTLPVEPAASRELGVAVRSLDDAPEMLKRFIACTQRIVRDLSE